MLNLITNYINENYGSKRGLLNTVNAQFRQSIGGFRALSDIDWQRVERTIFICHGNICRSPLAEAAARRAGLDTQSYGLSCKNGAMADPRAIRYAEKTGLNLNAHRSQNISKFSPAEGDLVVVMEPKHLAGLSAEINNMAQVTLAGLWLPKRRPYIHDPFSAGGVFFDRCAAQVVSSTDLLIGHIKSQRVL